MLLTLFLFINMSLSHCMCMNAFLVCVSVSTCVPGAHGGRRRTLDLLELKLQMVGSCRVQQMRLMSESCVQDQIYLFTTFFISYKVWPASSFPRLDDQSTEIPSCPSVNKVCDAIQLGLNSNQIALTACFSTTTQFLVKGRLNNIIIWTNVHIIIH